MKRIAVYPGSFDPITNGHLDIIRRGLEIFDELIILVARNSSKQGLFTVEERLDLIAEAFDHDPRIRVDSFQGLLVDYMASHQVRVIIRGLRAVSDFEYEFQIAQMNHSLQNQIETLFMMTSTKYAYLSSSIVKEVASHRGAIDAYVPPAVRDALVKKFSQK